MIVGKEFSFNIKALKIAIIPLTSRSLLTFFPILSRILNIIYYLFCILVVCNFLIKPKNYVSPSDVGLTSIGPIVFRDEESIIAKAQSMGRDLRSCYRNDIMPFKGALECWYVDNQSVLVDIKILIATAVAVLMPSWKGYRTWFHGLPSPESALVREHYS